MQTGLYEQLLTLAIKEKLDGLGDPRLYTLAPVEREESHNTIAQLLEHVLAESLATFRGSDVADRQKQLVDRLVGVLTEELGGNWSNQLTICNPLQRLLAIHQLAGKSSTSRPDTPLARSALLTGTRLDLSLGSQLCKELATADRVDILCSFIRWSGLRVLLNNLRQLAEQSSSCPRIRVITTCYMGATDPKAIEELSRLPNTEIRVSYDTKRTRLHAKAYIFHRETGFGSAYVGSANISNAALSEGLEWTTKLSHYELPYLWNKIAGTFETYWQDNEFCEYSGEAPERLRQAIAREKSGSQDAGATYQFDLHPYPFQEEILDVLNAEREVQQKSAHLVVAATGTGKTMIAAFDYARIGKAKGSTPSLLFIAHREEILRQALGTFRGVLRDQNFGELLFAGREPEQETHLFCSIQSYNSRELWRRPADEYCYVVIDEFHHAAAPSYRRLLDHVRPQILLGLTATPERTDQLDVLQWFGGRASAEIRLPDAINRRLLCPFQYFGVADSVDLDSVTWHRGAYDVSDLERLYTGNDVRARLIVDKVHEIVLDPRKARGLGFCVSVAHAEFMARFFNESGLPSIALTGESPDDIRQRVQERLRKRDLNFIFCVDLYNEGVDLPEVDTLLFLRPTESLTVFLQQLGRGLRLQSEKDCVTVLDFIGAQRREFRFASRFRALSTNPTARLDDEIERGLPHLPSGCLVQLERVAQQRVLDNVREAIRLIRPRLVSNIRELGRYLGQPPSIAQAIDFLDVSLDELLKRGLWSQLLADAGIGQPPQAPDGERLATGLLRLCHVDDVERIRFLLRYFGRMEPVRSLSIDDQRRLEMLHVTLWGSEGTGWTIDEANERLALNPSAVSDLIALLQFQLSRAPVQHNDSMPFVAAPLAIHSQYTQDEILVGLGHRTLTHRPRMTEGVLHLPNSRTDSFFVTLQKTESDYSPTTMYEDYLISSTQFHWQSQSTTSEHTPTGQRYIRHAQTGYTPLLFVRETKQRPSGIAAPYVFLGPCDYVKHEGSRPMSIVWGLRHPVPARLYRQMARQATG